MRYESITTPAIDSPMLALLTDHYAHLTGDSTMLPIPSGLTGSVYRILSLRNPAYPRHFTNAIHVIIKDVRQSHEFATELRSYVASIPAEWVGTCATVRCCIHGLTAATLSTFTSPDNPSTCIATLSYVMRWPQGQAFCSHPSPSSSDLTLEDGSAYFKERFPAKASLVGFEQTLLLSRADIRLAHIQLLSTPPITAGQTSQPTLITGLEVRPEHRGHGYARYLCEHVVKEHGEQGDVLVLANVDNLEAVALYVRMGFRIESIYCDVDLMM
ncbi:hypothetical protein GLOTRDRAFT_95962 [Gloeophyllum trabeum ATCC 11539]|uniref:N-acetyltransferase domain-containing protein n=1 Tax=Gloeophyllum trabeum (strain ATCC 11539 / FP-39264 / Madison 617) TaxID=670483 RepID=S7RID4_GLOTA|nr:uncharacterized protein GLOTRDRAFT_95962 [Gloeophyllum trabeum ATCC 11539]EPQ52369.1 hypothetical protein GLOTRDRAFT_95962 [Gloeophyllum trabeum ATCC 11539]